MPDPRAWAVNAFSVDWSRELSYAFPPFSMLGKTLQKIERDNADMILIAPHWPTQNWYPKLLRLLADHPILPPLDARIVSLPFDRDRPHPLGRKLRLMACHLSGKVCKQEEYHNVLKKSYSVDGDRVQRNSMWCTWTDGNDSVMARVCNPIYTTVGVVLDFLTNLFEAAHSYSSINTARSALSTVVILQDETTTVGKHPLICKFMKGVFHERPALPRYQATWDVQIVLNRLKKWAPVRKLSLKELTLKLIMLLALVSGQRCQTLHALSLDNMSVGKSSYKFHVTTLVKQSAPGRAQPIVILPAFPADRRLCIYTVLKEYLDRTCRLRTSRKLLLSFVKPYGAVTKSTVGRWIKTVLALSGVDITVYGAHSTRASSTSQAYKNNVPIETVMQAAGWRNQSTFTKFYHKEVQAEDSFACGVLTQKIAFKTDEQSGKKDTSRKTELMILFLRCILVCLLHVVVFLRVKLCS